MTLIGTHTEDNLLGGDKSLKTIDISIASGSHVRGLVMGRVKTATPANGTADAGNTGDGTCTLVTGGPKTKKGVYTLTCEVAVTNGGTFRVTNPDGNFIGHATILAGAGGVIAFKSDELNFTLTDGATDFVIGDKFTVTVSDGVPTTGTPDGGNTGNGTVTEVEGRSALKVGVYTVICTAAVTHGGVFNILDPDSNIIGSATIPPGAGNNIVFTHDQITLKITDGSTDFIVGDEFTITTTIAPRECKPLDKTATDGSSVPYIVLAEAADASSARISSVGYVEGEFNERSLTFASGTDIEDVREAMRTEGLLVVSSKIA